METRLAQINELRASGEGKLAGYAAVFNKRSVNLGGFVEVISPGAFRSSLERDQDIRALINHDGVPIARRKNGTLSLVEDDTGLRVEIDLPDTTAGHDLRKSVERGDIDQMSFGFNVRDDAVDEEDGLLIRILRDVDLREVSIVTFPAYPDTSIAKRSVQDFLESKTKSSMEAFNQRFTGRASRELKLRNR